MEYEIIERNEYGVLVKNTTTIIDCKCCKYIHKCCGYCYYKSYYLTDQEAAKLETEPDSQKELLDLQIENKKLKEIIEELESENTTELITEKEDYYGAMTNITKTKCCGIAPITNENFCPNCGRKIMR